MISLFEMKWTEQSVLKKVERWLRGLAFNKVKLDLTADQFVEYIIQSDPTDKKDYVNWITNTITKGGDRVIFPEDIVRYNKAIEYFELAKKKQSVKIDRHIDKYKTLRQLEAAIMEFVKEQEELEAAGKEEPEEEHSRVLYHKKYVNNAYALLGLDGPETSVEFWFRQILTPYGGL